MKVIYKYPCSHSTYLDELPQGAQILSLGHQGNGFVYWALVDLEAPKVFRRLELLMTGEETSEYMTNAKYCGTATDPFGIVMHLFDLGEGNDSIA